MTGPIERELPAALADLATLATDLRWTWNHAGDRLWRTINETVWQRSKNPYTVLRVSADSRLQQLAEDKTFLALMDAVVKEHDYYATRITWYQKKYPTSLLKKIAFFSMEYGLGEALPFYAGGLGVLAGDFLKTASDLGVPLVAIGLLFHHGYFRQLLDRNGEQQELYPNYDSASLPVYPVLTDNGDRLNISVHLPGRKITISIWQAIVGRVTLYLLDSSHPENIAPDRGITSQLYPVSSEARLLQQMVLGMGGWRMLAALNLSVDICHMNEGHCAFAVLERAHHYMQVHQVSFEQAMLATRAGNIFTTHTPVPAAFDCYPAQIGEKYLSVYANLMNVPVAQIMAIGSPVHNNQGAYNSTPDNNDVFAPLYLALRASNTINAVSQSHQQVMRSQFQALYPRWPQQQVPLRQITNGVHVPSWDSLWADRLWTQAAGKARWLGDLQSLIDAITRQSDEALWQFKCNEREDLVHYVRQRLNEQLQQAGASDAELEAASHVLDPSVLTLGFARRFTSYKRPDLLLKDKQRLASIINNHHGPVQIIVAGKAHPLDLPGKQLIREWTNFARDTAVKHAIVFLADYDIALAQELVQGVDVWINTPRYPWEACGTSGMKVLVNGGLNLSVLDGWWAQAYKPQFGWAVGNGQQYNDNSQDEKEANAIYQHLEQRIIPEFYRRDKQGLPRQWIARMRISMAKLTAQYSSNTMLREYTQSLYIPASKQYRQRTENAGELSKKLLAWQHTIEHHWHEVRWLDKHISEHETGFNVDVRVHLGAISADYVKVQLYADAQLSQQPECIEFQPVSVMTGAAGEYLYRITVHSTRPVHHYTPRIIAWHKNACIPGECARILWWDS